VAHSQPILSKVLAMLDNFATKKRVCDVQDLFQRFTLDSIGEIAFGVNIGSLDKDVAFANAFDLVTILMSQRGFHPFFRIRFLRFLVFFISFFFWFAFF
jgi:hypothetical protein